MAERLCIRFGFCLPLPFPPGAPLVGVEAGSEVEDETAGFFVSVLPFPEAGVEDLGGAAAGVDTTFFPLLSVETGGTAEDETVSFPPFPLLLVEEGTSEETAVGLTTEVDEISLETGGTAEDETLLALCPLSVTVIWRGAMYQHLPNRCMRNNLSRRSRR
jgi:hypothetical protein